MSLLRYLIFDNGELIRKVASRQEAEVYVLSGCDLKVLPKPKRLNDSDKFNQAYEILGDCLV